MFGVASVRRRGQPEGSAKPLIPSDGRAKLVLTYQLRGTLRGTPTPVDPTDDIANVAQATLVSPGGIGCGGGVQPCNAPSASDSGQLDIRKPDYAVKAVKTITPAFTRTRRTATP